MAIADEELKVPSAPHGVTNNKESYNDWPNDAGVCSVFAHPFDSPMN